MKQQIFSISLLLLVALLPIGISFAIPSKNRRFLKIEALKLFIIQYAEEPPDSKLK